MVRAMVYPPPDGIVRKVFEISAITRLIPTYEDVGSAIARAVAAALDDASEDAPDDVIDSAPTGEPDPR
jgi:hypothetical protein